jgi:hypothetical protein
MGYKQGRAAELPKGSDGPHDPTAFHVFVPAFKDTGVVIVPYIDVGDGSGLGAGALMVYTPEALTAGDVIPDSVLATAATMDKNDPLPAGWSWWPALYAGRSAPVDKVAALQSDGYLAYLAASSLKSAYYLEDGAYSDKITRSLRDVSFGDGDFVGDEDEDQDEQDEDETDTCCAISEDWFSSYTTDHGTITILTGGPERYSATEDSAMEDNIRDHIGDDLDDGEFTTNYHTYAPNRAVETVHTAGQNLEVVTPIADMVSTFCPLFEMYIGFAGAVTRANNRHRPSLLLFPSSSFHDDGDLREEVRGKLGETEDFNLGTFDGFTKLVVPAPDMDLFGEPPEEIWYGVLAPYIQHFDERNVSHKVLHRSLTSFDGTLTDEPNTHQTIIWMAGDGVPRKEVMDAALAAMLRPEHPYFAGYTETDSVSRILPGVRLRLVEDGFLKVTVPWYTGTQPIEVSTR